ncbi:g13394 [Coccomyxa viridis]|uniref:G13394 protein n=1 Tax=Coccomyxa viridis TaxID=1274662 RepID=A0ABP1GJT5_9CHLO
MASDFGPTVEQKPSATHTATIIFLHGLGDTGAGISTVAQALRLPHILFKFPTAPTRPVTMNGGARMPAWFDLDFRITARTDSEGIDQSIAYLEQQIQEEAAKGIPSERIAVGGFSQGGHIALKSLFKASQPLAACIALSTWLEPGLNWEVRTPKVREMPVFLGHGTSDPLIPLALAQSTANLLRQKGFSALDFRTYPGVQHSIGPQELQDIREFILKVLPEETAKPPALDDVDKMSVKELKAFLQSRSVNTRSILEKSELRDRVKALL